jgi:hypothetical protein
MTEMHVTKNIYFIEFYRRYMWGLCPVVVILRAMTISLLFQLLSLSSSLHHFIMLKSVFAIGLTAFSLSALCCTEQICVV